MRLLSIVVLVTACAPHRAPPPARPAAAPPAAPPTAPPVVATAADRCEQITTKLRPVITELAHGAGKEVPADFFPRITEDCRARPAESWTDGSGFARGSQCILDAPDQPAVRVCFEAQLREYRDSAKAIPDSAPSGSPEP